MPLKLNLFFFLVVISIAGHAECGHRYDISKYFFKIDRCHLDGSLLSTEEYLRDGERLSSESFYDERERIIKRIGYSSAGQANLKSFEYKEGSYIETIYIGLGPEIKNRVEFLDGRTSKIREWKFEGGELKWIDSLYLSNDTQIKSRFFTDTKLTYKFIYKDESRYGDEIKSFRVENEKGERVGEYHYDFHGNIEEVINDQFTGDILQEKLSIYRDTKRTPVGVIDSGFDLFHPAITPYLINNPLESWGGVDMDGNGLAGDRFGWSWQSGGKGSGNINEPVITGGFKPFPLSHGSHVASIALRNQSHAALVGYAGDVANPDYLNVVSRDLSERGVKVVNMSWGFKELGAPFTPPPASYSALKKLIMDNSQTLFHVAAGNNAWDLDGRLKDYPASYAYNNLLVIGSINVGDYNWKDEENLVPALYKNNLGSNIGKVSVDVFAPGKNVSGARLGGGMIPMSGTSMASPFAMNTSISLLKVDPNLEALEIKEIVMKSAGHLKKALPCVSEGFVHPERAEIVAELYLKGLSIDEAVLITRSDDSLLYPGEVVLSMTKMKSLFEKIDNSLKINTD